MQVYRVKEFSFLPAVEPVDEDEGEGEEREGQSKGGHQRLRSQSHPGNSVWNCEGELLEHPSIHIQ